ncbi:MAG: hypothetical protein Q9227_000499 [Pyrenula ochraceoflavens]
MSSLERLGITGIRSFDDESPQVIKFDPPLTLIVGLNGSGKTTIIECLKYATTGELPPNSKGGAFLHDPKIKDVREVMARVQLQFKATSGTTMTVMRNLSLTVKKTARQQKTLECALNIKPKDKAGDRTTISTRVAELDQIMPQYLGVSRAVLDNVIFCHQDESLWPLSEPAALKKKFDEIFEALKYTKAIDNIKQLRKKQLEELGNYKIMEQQAKENKEKATKNEKRSIKLQDEIETLRDECAQLDRTMNKVAEQADKTWNAAEEYSEIVANLEANRRSAASKRKEIKNLEEYLNPVNESDEELESMLMQFDERVAQYAEQQSLKDAQAVKLKDEIEHLRDQQSSKQIERGQYESEKAQYERHLQDRQEVAKSVAGKHKVRGFEDISDNRQFDGFMQQLQKKLKDSASALQRVKNENNQAKEDARTHLNRLSQRKSALQDVKGSAKERINQNDAEARNFQAKVNQIRIDEGARAVVESRLKEVGEQLARARETEHSAAWDKSLSETNSRLRDLEDEGARLNQELIQSSKRANELARLDHLKQELRNREHSLEILSNTHGDRISSLIQSDWQPLNVEKLYQGALQERSDNLKVAEGDRDTVSRDLENVEFSLRKLESDLKSKSSEMKDCESKIQEAIDDAPSEYPRSLREAQSALEKARIELKTYDGLEDWFNQCLELLEDAKEGKACRLCTRAWRPGDKGDKDRDAYRKRVRYLISRSKSEDGNKQIAEAERTVAAIRDAGLQYELWAKLSKTDLPSLKTHISDNKEQKATLLRKIESCDDVVSNRQEKKQDLESLAQTVSTITRHYEDIKNYNAQIEELTAKQASQGLNRTLEDIQAEINVVGENSRLAKRTLTDLTTERDQSRSNISSLEVQLSDAKNELNSANFELEKKAGLVARVEEYRLDNQKERQKIEKAEADINGLNPEVEKAEAKYDEISAQGDSRESRFETEKTQIVESIQSLNMANNEINKYVERGGSNQLSKCQNELQSLDLEIRQKGKEQSTITKTAEKIKQQLHDSEATRRQYIENKRYREGVRELKTLEEEIEKLASKNAEVDRDHFQEESKRLRHEHHMLSAQRVGKMGEMKSKDSQLRDLIADYETDYKNAAYHYKETHIKVETTKAAVEDLGRYGGALDKAIMKYHSLKMEEINQIIEELWQRTYQGTDVDTILIRSDTETAKGNRSYNYRVCMKKGHAEMDMRGRCSAGQKVLASIIIRLALAECFATNCGFIALDEPTTNLDSDNIQALAISLHDLIKSREKQANFQLIVITHDENFLRHMQCGDFADWYWRVERDMRNPDIHQRSVISMQSVAEVL